MEVIGVIMKWTEQEIEYLKNEYSKVNGKSITNITNRLASELGKKASSIRNKAYTLGITHKEKFYTEQEIEFLKNNIDKMTYDDMAVILKKNKCNICRKCKQLGLKKTKSSNSKLIELKPRHKFTKEDIEKGIAVNKEKYANGLHPKGYLGHKHSPETREKLSQASKRGWSNMTPEKLKERGLKMINAKIKNGTLNPLLFQKNPYSRARGGKRADLDNRYFRSAWEANIARYYNFIGVKWEYEPKTFIFQNITRGSVSYTPDFYLPDTDEWVEVKGWFDGKSKTKLKRFAKQYPEEYKKLSIIQEKEYNEIKRKVSSFIPNWE